MWPWVPNKAVPSPPHASSCAALATEADVARVCATPPHARSGVRALRACGPGRERAATPHVRSGARDGSGHGVPSGGLRRDDDVTSCAEEASCRRPNFQPRPYSLLSLYALHEPSAGCSSLSSRCPIYTHQ